MIDPSQCTLAALPSLVELATMQYDNVLHITLGGNHCLKKKVYAIGAWQNRRDSSFVCFIVPLHCQTLESSNYSSTCNSPRFNEDTNTLNCRLRSSAHRPFLELAIPCIRGVRNAAYLALRTPQKGEHSVGHQIRLKY